MPSPLPSPGQSPLAAWRIARKVPQIFPQSENLRVPGCESGNQNSAIRERVRDSRRSRQISWRATVRSFEEPSSDSRPDRGRIEDNAVCVQVRVEGARRIVSKQSCREVACESVGLCAAGPNASCGECLELPQGQLHGPRMSFENTFIFAQESREGYRLWR